MTCTVLQYRRQLKCMKNVDQRTDSRRKHGCIQERAQTKRDCHGRTSFLQSRVGSMCCEATFRQRHHRWISRTMTRKHSDKSSTVSFHPWRRCKKGLLRREILVKHRRELEGEVIFSCRTMSQNIKCRAVFCTGLRFVLLPCCHACTVDALDFIWLGWRGIAPAVFL